jgi:hypothetical protein
VGVSPAGISADMEAQSAEAPDDLAAQAAPADMGADQTAASTTPPAA